MLPVILLPLAVMAPGTDPAHVADGWEFVWDKWCTFEQEANVGEPEPCRAFVRRTTAKAEDGTEYAESGYMWHARDGREVRYVSKVGAVGMSIATIGVVSDNRYEGGVSYDPAVTYSPHRNSLIIAVPNEGYEFEVCDFEPRKKGC
ncbi:hypothetical protein [Erythrobacter colymbi]|uniref:hypothetical protein n=1 Tax=Erythrobacter colymbi TaxID=1161202 RepID=UPI000A367892|nr:hypothetical protein [Erythrobacter colymbi]